jgi:hypothetical protein
MSSETSKPSANQENAKNNEQTEEESLLKDAVDAQDLALKGRTIQDPEELKSNPAVAPQMLNDPADIKEGFKFERD